MEQRTRLTDLLSGERCLPREPEHVGERLDDHSCQHVDQQELREDVPADEKSEGESLRATVRFEVVVALSTAGVSDRIVVHVAKQKKEKWGCQLEAQLEGKIGLKKRRRETRRVSPICISRQTTHAFQPSPVDMKACRFSQRSVMFELSSNRE